MPKPNKRPAKKSKPRRAATTKPAAKKPVKLLSGGNPQITKADGDAPVQAYIAAMPGWKGVLGRRLDALITRSVPGVQKAVRWNTPFYGMQGQGWFVGFHCLKECIKVAFLRGAQLSPEPPIKTKQKDPRYLDIHEGETLDEKQFVDWVKQASQLPGWKL